MPKYKVKYDLRGKIEFDVVAVNEEDAEYRADELLELDYGIDILRYCELIDLQEVEVPSEG